MILGQVSVNPVTGIKLPKAGKRLVIVPVEQAELMLAALPPTDRIVWGLAFFGGLRRGEARGLRWSDVDFDNGLVEVSRAWCNRTARITPPKSPAAVRSVPMPSRLRQLLLEHRMASGRPAASHLVAAGYVSPTRPISADALYAHAAKAWEKLDGVPAGFDLHSARHTYASLMIATKKVDAKELCEFMGHASIAITFDTYGKLFPGAHAKAAAALDGYLEAQATPGGSG